ncbi:MAG: hypothetical protein ACLU80_11255 [Dorea sp.]
MERVSLSCDYMFPKSKEDTVSTISDQLGAYREIKERVEDLENLNPSSGVRSAGKNLALSDDAER